MREYRKNGKSDRYTRLLKEFEVKFKKTAGDFMRKNIDSLKNTNPGRAYSILKKMGAQPGDCEETNTFTLPTHDNLTIQEATDRIAEHFSKVSREFPPIDEDQLPERVTLKTNSPESESPIPKISEHEVYENIQAANKPKSGVPGDMPKRLVTEFSPELSVPMCSIFNNIAKSARQGRAKWPSSWKLEYGTALQKIPNPLTEDDLTVIALTSFFSKVMEKFVVQWLMFYVGSKMDPRQFGGLRGNSISHYMIELIHFILYNQDYNLPIAVLACTVDFSKAFNRQNHNLLITKLSDMGVPGWLLNIVMGFLSDRVMVLRYKGETSDQKALPGGGPQGTLLGLLLFLILINSCGFSDQKNNVGDTITNKKKTFKPTTLHTKFVDDMTIAESFNVKETLVPNPIRPQPDSYHARLGQKLPAEKSLVYKQLKKIEQYADDNQMKLNFSKTKFMLFNPTKTFDFIPEYKTSGSEVETLEEMKLLGLVLRNDLSWSSNTEYMTKKAYKKLWMVRRLKSQGANYDDLKDVYIKQVRSTLEFGVPVWNCGITKSEVSDIERVQKSFLHIVLGRQYVNYQEALDLIELETLKERRTSICEKFAKKSMKHPKHKSWFVVNQPPGAETRSIKPDLKPPLCRLNRFKTSPIPYLTSLLNKQ